MFGRVLLQERCVQIDEMPLTCHVSPAVQEQGPVDMSIAAQSAQPPVDAGIDSCFCVREFIPDKARVILPSSYVREPVDKPGTKWSCVCV